MSVQGKRIAPQIEAFVVNAKRTAPGLTHQDIANQVWARFGEDSKIDRSSVSRILIRGSVQNVEPVECNATGTNSGPTGNTESFPAAMAREHRRVLMEPLSNLKGIQPPGVHDYDLAIWHSRQNEASWPISKGRVWRKSRGPFEIRLDIEGELRWRYLRQHLSEDPLWPALDDWKNSIRRDLRCRLALLQQVIEQIQRPEDQGGIGLPVATDLMDSVEAPAVGLYYAFTIHDQALSRQLGLAHGAKAEEQFTAEVPGVTYLGNYPAVRALDREFHQQAVRYLLEAQEAWTESRAAKAAAKAFRQAEAATAAVQSHLERLELAIRFPANSYCDACNQPGYSRA